MSRRHRNKEKSWMGSYLPIMGMIFLVAGIAFVSSYILYGNRLSKSQANNQNLLSAKIDNTSNITNEQIAETGTKIGRTVDELTNSLQNSENDIEKRAVNTSNVENDILNQRQENNVEEKTSININDDNVENTSVEQIVLKFERPVEGEVLKDYSDENLVYSNTLNEWCTHLGIDYRAEKTSIVKSAEDGIIKSIKNDPRYGLTVVVKHENGFETMYANLLSTEFITVGEKVVKGQTIATVGNTATFEAAEETHLHFEMFKDGKNVNPNMYLN